MPEETKTITIKKDTWKWLHSLKLDNDFKNLDETLYHALGVLDMVSTLAKKHNEPDVINFTKEMVYYYDDFLKNKYKKVIR